jgi:hypothetical protein
VLEYISKCCNVPARKPLAGAKEIIKDADTGKFIDKPKGLGHWRCQGCGKPCKVIPRKPQPKTVPEVSTVVPNVSTQEVPSDTGQSQ